MIEIADCASPAVADRGVGARGRGAADGFALFYATEWPALFAFAATLTGGDLLAAEDVAQETMARVLARFGGLDEPRPYAFRVASNLVRRRWRNREREAVVEPAMLPERGVADERDDTLDAVLRLPERMRSAVVLHYYADLPVETVAGLLHRPVGTVKRRLHEARARLALVLEERS